MAILLIDKLFNRFGDPGSSIAIPQVVNRKDAKDPKGLIFIENREISILYKCPASDQGEPSKGG